MFVWYLTSALRNRERSPPKAKTRPSAKEKRQADEGLDTHKHTEYMLTQVSPHPPDQPASLLCHCASRGDRRTFCPHCDADLNQGKPHIKSRENAALALLCFAWMEEEGGEEGGPSRIHCGWTWQLRERPPRKSEKGTSASKCRLTTILFRIIDVLEKNGYRSDLSLPGSLPLPNSTEYAVVLHVPSTAW